MSDYISKNKAVESLKKYKFGAICNDEEREYTKEMVLVILNGIPTISETEIIRKAFERVVERLKKERHPEICGGWETMRIDRAIEIVKEECGINE